MKSIIVGISGGTGSGKSTVSNRLKEHFGDLVTIIHCDDYYKSIEEGQSPADVNWDHPDAIDHKRLYKDLLDLSKGNTIEKPVYDFASSSSIKTETMEPNRIIIVDGIFALYEEEINKLYDFKLFVMADADIRILRRTQRDLVERGRDISLIFSQYVKTVKESHEKYVEPQKWNSDFILVNNSEGTFPKIDKVYWLLDYMVRFGK